MFYKVFCIFTGNKVHDYGREEIYAGGYPGARAGRGICVRQQSDVNRNHECTENGKENAQKTVTTVHKNQ